MNSTDLDFDSMQEKALRQLRSGESLYVKDGAFAPLLKRFLEAALEAVYIPLICTQGFRAYAPSFSAVLFCLA